MNTSTDTATLQPPTKKDTKRTLQMFAEFAIKGVLQGVPRQARRAAARKYVTESYRVLTDQPRYRSALNTEVINWIVREYKDYRSKTDVSGVAREASSGSDAGSPTSGPDQRDSTIDLSSVTAPES